MIKKIKVNNFRSLQDDFELEFDDNFTLVVGENDAGKSSVVDSLKVILEGRKVDRDDFAYNSNFIRIELETENDIFISEHYLEDDIINSKLYIEFTHEDLEQIILRVEELNENGNDEDLAELKKIADKLGVTYRSNSTVNSITNNISSKVDELKDEGNPTRCESKSLDINSFFLDGKYFEDISLFINEMFFKDKRKNIWSEEIQDTQTLEDVIKNKLEAYAGTIATNINEGGIKEKIQEFLPSLTEISVSSAFEPKDLNISIVTKMLENDSEISISKKGDGTKRRITMALLDYKNEQEEDSSIYILDEPDTHLHVRAQLELLNIIEGFTREEKQVLITTHSPFIINACRPEQLRLLINNNGVSNVKSLFRDSEVNNILRNMGVENTYLFFAKKILLIEGQTEERFLPTMFERIIGKKPQSSLIKIINVKGIRNVPGFASALLEILDKDSIYALTDNDADESTQELIDRLNMNEDNMFVVGTKEFEDSFTSKTIYECWKEYVEHRGREISDLWTEESIQQLKEECLANGSKFSKKLRSKNQGSKKLDKVTLGIALSEYCSEEELDENLRNLIYVLNE